MMFLCGVEVEVSFSALYSNVLVAFATIKTTGPRTQDCTVTLSSLPVNICFKTIILSSFIVMYVGIRRDQTVQRHFRIEKEAKKNPKKLIN